ncbi:hypothetical protein LR002_03205 [Candidatus Gracilibacteria bacterium]|nr:hypothetical protein [Candidatus Gracilibacteria bacterium]
MEFLTELMSKMTIENLFKLQPSTDFSYSYLVFGFLIFLVVFSFVFDYIAKHQENKFLRKAMKGEMAHVRWTLPLVGAFLLVSRLEGIPFFNMKFLLIIYLFVVIGHFVYLYFDIKKQYLKKLEKQEKYSKK